MADEKTREDILTVTVPKTASGERLDRFLAREVPQFSRTRLKRLIEEGHVVLADGARAEADSRVIAGARYTLAIPEPVASHLEPEALALDIVFEDEALVVVNKPAGLVVHPAPGNPGGTLVNALIAHCGPALLDVGGRQRPGLVHRLDKDTSGLMVAAKTDRAYRGLVAQFATREIRRVYHGVAWGVPSPARGGIVAAIGRDPVNRKKMAVREHGGRPAETRYELVKVLANGVASMLECTLKTGRTHQIRVHLTHLGHPLIGDRVYGRSPRGSPGGKAARLTGETRAAVVDFRRQALHASTLAFVHPLSGAPMDFTSDLPEDLRSLISSLETL